MGFTTWHNYGYGVNMSRIQIASLERFLQLLDQAPQLKKDIYEWLIECEITEPALDDFLEYDQDYCLGIVCILSEVIQEAEGVQFLACDDFDGDRFLVYPPKYPWFLPEDEQILTEEKIRDILHKYISIISDDEIEIYYQEIENGG